MPRECKGGWIRTYLEYTKGQQSPTIFHTWAAISTIASALRRKCWIERGGFYKVYPNLYIILISEPGVGNKSTAIEIATDTFLEKAVPDLTIMRGAITVKCLIDWMTQALSKSPDQTAEVTIYCDEFKVFAKGLYADSGIIENLTKLYGCGVWEYGTGGQGILRVEKPCINLIAASTPEWLTTGLASDFVGGGFSSRIVPVGLVTDEKQIANPKKPINAIELEKKLISDLAQISQLRGSFLVTKDAEDFFAKWYVVRHLHKNPDQRMKGYYAKKHTQVQKVAMILSASIDDDMVITEEHLISAIQLFDKLELTIPFAFQGVAWGDKAKYQDKVLAKIQEAGAIQHAHLLQAFHYCLTGDDLRGIINTLTEEEQIGYDKIVTGGRTKVVYVTENYIKEQIKQEGIVKTQAKFMVCAKLHPEWFVEEKKKGGNTK